MTFNQIPTIRILDPLKPSVEVGIIPKSGLIVYDAFNDLRDTEVEQFMEIRVGGGGTLLVRGIDGNVIPYIGVQDGQWLVGEGNMILTSATINGNLYTTSCTDIVVYGGQ